MSLIDDISMLSHDEPSIIEDSLKFKVKLDIGDEAYGYLKNAHNFLDWLGAIGAGLGSGSIAGVAWYTTLGIFSKAALLFGLAATPVGWFVGAGALGAISAYAIAKVKKSATNKEEKELYDKIPKYINTPLDVLGLSLSALILPVAIKMAKSDSTLCKREYEVITKYLVNGWGYNRDYIKNAIIEQEQLLDKFNYTSYSEALIQATRQHKEVRFDVLKREMLHIMKEIMNADDEVKPEELEEMKLLEEAFRALRNN